MGWLSRLLVLLVIVVIAVAAYRLYGEYSVAKSLSVEIADASIARMGLTSADLNIK